MIVVQVMMTLIMLFAIVFLFAWVFRPGSSEKYEKYSKIPLNKD